MAQHTVQDMKPEHRKEILGVQKYSEVKFQKKQE